MTDIYARAPAADGALEIQESHLPREISAKEYAITRFSTLKPPMNKAPNPVRLLGMLTGKQWLFFLVAFLAWVCFYSTSYLVSSPFDILPPGSLS